MSSAPLVKCDQMTSNFKKEKRKICKNHLERISEGGILTLRSRNFRDYTYPVPPRGLCSLSSRVRQWPVGQMTTAPEEAIHLPSMNQSYSFDSFGPRRTEYATMWFVDVMTSMESKALTDLTWSHQRVSLLATQANQLQSHKYSFRPTEVLYILATPQWTYYPI